MKYALLNSGMNGRALPAQLPVLPLGFKASCEIKTRLTLNVPHDIAGIAGR